MKPTLLLLAAGMGTRYGGLKQLDGVGPNGETIMDYSIYDAIRAGFGKAVFVIRKDFEEEFRNKVLSKYENLIETEIVFQDVNSLPVSKEICSMGMRQIGSTFMLNPSLLFIPIAVILFHLPPFLIFNSYWI